MIFFIRLLLICIGPNGLKQYASPLPSKYELKIEGAGSSCFGYSNLAHFAMNWVTTVGDRVATLRDMGLRLCNVAAGNVTLRTYHGITQGMSRGMQLPQTRGPLVARSCHPRGAAYGAKTSSVALGMAVVTLNVSTALFHSPHSASYITTQKQPCVIALLVP
jgi:hypothetical protein